MKRLQNQLIIAVWVVLMVSTTAVGQTKMSQRSRQVFTAQLRQLDSLANLPDETMRAQQVDQWWETLRTHQQIPLIAGDSVAFLYKGNASSVWWQGDFNGWGRWAGGQIFQNAGHRVGKSDVWLLKASFPRDARLDYKVVLNGREWIPDPDNPYQQWGGGGPNSEVRMPNWKPEPVTENRTNIRKGVTSENLLIHSRNMGYYLYYRVYTPVGYENLSDLPVIYVTDGQEYADEKLGAMINVLDNLIADKKIRPIIAVFIDPRETSDLSNNRRMRELPLNDQYLAFVTQELVPHIDKQYKTNPNPQTRAILGTSLGGLNAAFFGVKASQTFRLIGIHSPAFWYRPDIYKLYETSPRQPLKLFMTTGVMSDTEEGARKMKSILEKKRYAFKYREVNEGHSWGNWRALIDDVLIYFYKP